MAVVSVCLGNAVDRSIPQGSFERHLSSRVSCLAWLVQNCVANKELLEMLLGMPCGSNIPLRLLSECEATKMQTRLLAATYEDGRSIEENIFCV
ncbi:uncharacterized protein RAG0_04604 [Rhynchosporium agropyri]|uniref:Uncharacterized protein n=1 Tax=Rhynchosporium agropyri TaxID=914238 RepID=A0A1E1K9E2_9HELO|nr:uncharacterized protein RAG0_04604 [Rhynchosporium agropyri]